MRHWFRAVALAAVLVCSGCVTFEHGIVDRPLPNDPRLFGVWSVPDEREISTIVKISPTKFAVKEFDRRSCTYKDGKYVSATRTEIGGRNFLQLFAKPDGDAPNERHLTFIAYDFDAGGHLIASFPDADVFERAIESGELPGTITDPKDKDGRSLYEHGPDIHVTASTPRLRAFLEDHAEAMRASPETPPTKLDRPPATMCKK
jgi:hypothetical protein